MEKIYIKKGKEVLFIDLRCVYIIESEGNYSMFYYIVNGVSSRGSVLNTLNNLDKVLPSNFFRVSRFCIVNLNYKESIQWNIDNTGIITLNNGQEVNVSRRKFVELNKMLKGISVIGVKKKNVKNNNRNSVGVLDKIIKSIISLFSRRW
jgi:DNA-binding LytR/AlgR family response regulator